MGSFKIGVKKETFMCPRAKKAKQIQDPDEQKIYVLDTSVGVLIGE